MDIVKVEFAENFKMVTDKWNRKTNSWLRYYVYMRLYPREGKAPFSVTMLTYLTSAFWHVRGPANERRWRGKARGVAHAIVIAPCRDGLLMLAQGFYAGYYMTFMSGAVVTEVARRTCLPARSAPAAWAPR